MLKKAGVAILGLGVVGGGTYEILTKNTSGSPFASDLGFPENPPTKQEMRV